MLFHSRELNVMRQAGQAAFNRGAVCVPGLDMLWMRAVKQTEEGRQGEAAVRLANLWRSGWVSQAAVAAPKKCPDCYFDGFTFYDCVYELHHDGECAAK